MSVQTVISEPLTAPAATATGRLQDKVAVITGAARGIGAVTAATFAREGAKVVICDVNEALGQQTVEAINEAAGAYIQNGKPAATFVPADVRNMESVEDLFSSAVQHYGRVDILVNNAGVTRDAQLKKMTEEEFDFVIDINLRGVFACTKIATRYMLEQGSGVVLNAASVVGLDGNFGQTNYTATKAGVIGMTQVWSRELGPKGIRVNAVAPGFIETPMTEKMPEKVYNAMVSNTPLRRAGKPQDIANAYLWLASDEASFVNGAVLRVDGGIRIGT